MASQLKLNMADYKSQLDQSLKSCSESFQLTLNDTNTLMIKKFTSKDMAFRIAVIPLKKTDPLTSIPEIMRIIAKSITSMSNDLNEKEKTIAEIQNSNNSPFFNKIILLAFKAIRVFFNPQVILN